jgi:hypothetical protein
MASGRFVRHYVNPSENPIGRRTACGLRPGSGGSIPSTTELESVTCENCQRKLVKAGALPPTNPVRVEEALEHVLKVEYELITSLSEGRTMEFSVWQGGTRKPTEHHDVLSDAQGRMSVTAAMMALRAAGWRVMQRVEYGQDLAISLVLRGSRIHLMYRRGV